MMISVVACLLADCNVQILLLYMMLMNALGGTFALLR